MAKTWYPTNFSGCFKWNVLLQNHRHSYTLQDVSSRWENKKIGQKLTPAPFMLVSDETVILNLVPFHGLCHIYFLHKYIFYSFVLVCRFALNFVSGLLF